VLCMFSTYTRLTPVEGTCGSKPNNTIGVFHMMEIHGKCWIYAILSLCGWLIAIKDIIRLS